MPIGARTIIKKPDKTEKKIAPFAAFFQKFGAPLDAVRQTTTVGMKPRMMHTRLAKENEEIKKAQQKKPNIAKPSFVNPRINK